MIPTTCPYLMIKGDPDLKMGYPSVLNCCRRARPIVPVRLEHQETHCLSTNFINCPVPANDINMPLPEELRELVPTRKIPIIPAALFSMAIISIVVIGLWLSGFLTRSSVPSPFKTEEQSGILTTHTLLTTNGITTPGLLTTTLYTPTSLPTLMPTDLPSSSETPSPSVIPILTATPTQIPSPTLTATPAIIPGPTITGMACTPPSGWVSYLVQPNDSLVLLARNFGISITELQEANCMGSSTIIDPGQVIYVPNIPTRTPTRYRTRIPTRTPTLTKRKPHTQTPVPMSTNTKLPTNTASPTYKPTPSATRRPTNTITPPHLPTKTITPPP
jgi:LysM repeat protein